MAKKVVDKPELVVIAVAHCMAIHLDAGHDTNGNPKRAYVVLHREAGILVCVNEAYNGRSAMKQALGEAGDLIPIIGTFQTSKSQLRSLLKDFPTFDGYKYKFV